MGAAATPIPRPLEAIGLRWALPAVAALGLSLLAIQRSLPAPEARTFYRVVYISMVLGTAGLFLWRGSRPGEPASGWRWLASALGAQALLAISMPGLPNAVPLLLVQVLAIISCFIIGVIRWFDQGPFWGGGVRRILEGMAFTLAVMTLTWGSILHVPGHDLGPVWHRIAANIGLAGLVTGVAMFQALVDPRRLLGPLGWAFGFFLVSTVINAFAFRAQVLGLWGPGHWSYDVRLPVFLLLPMAFFAPWTRDALTREEGRGQNLWGYALVYIPVAATLLWLPVALLLGRDLDAIQVALTAMLALLILIRQVIALRDQASFSRILQGQLEHRTRSLEEHQGILMRHHRMNLVATLGAGLAHDFNNLLTVVIQEIDTGSSSVGLDAARRASALARQMMALGGQERLDLELFELGALLRDRQALLQRVCRKDISLTLQVEPEECWLEADPLQVEQVVLNLVSNARDAIPAAGFIRIRLRRLPSGQALLEVEDSGPGMDSETRDRLFEPFFTTKTQGKGSGLGLASVKAIVQSLGGTVDVFTELGLGTTFRIKLPTIPIED